MWSCRLSTISKVRLNINFVLYEENTGHMHQIAPLTTSKCKKALTDVPPPTPSAPPRSLHSLGLGRFAPSHVIFTASPKIKSWLRHWLGWKMQWGFKWLSFSKYRESAREKIQSRRVHCMLKSPYSGSKLNNRMPLPLYIQRDLGLKRWFHHTVSPSLPHYFHSDFGIEHG